MAPSGEHLECLAVPAPAAGCHHKAHIQPRAGSHNWKPSVHSARTHPNCMHLHQLHGMQTTSGRCAVCKRAKKGRCGTDTAPAK